jgi:YggT family protein
MSILTDITLGLGQILLSLINIYIWVVIINALLSFVNPDPYNPIVQFLHRVTNPVYRFVRRYIPTNVNGLDLAPLVVIIGLQVIVVVLDSFMRSLH